MRAIDEVLRMAESDMTNHRQLSRGVYFSVYEQAANGVEFCTRMSVRDAYKLRALMNRHGHQGKMRQQMQEDGNMRVCFNL